MSEPELMEEMAGESVQEERLVLPNVGTYEGGRNEMFERHGWGRATLPMGDVYEGEYEYNLRHGHGLYFYHLSGAHYEGTWENGYKSGYGLFYYADGSVYNGEWKDDVRHGDGIYQYKNGDLYVGQWRNGNKHGRGAYHYFDCNSEYQGLWKNGQRYGFGVLNFGPFRYIGNFISNIPAGDAKIIFSHGTEQRGRFLRRKPGSDVLEGGLHTPPKIPSKEAPDEIMEEEGEAVVLDELLSISDGKGESKKEEQEKDYDQQIGEEDEENIYIEGESISTIEKMVEEEDEVVEWTEGMELIWKGYPLEKIQPAATEAPSVVVKEDDFKEKFKTRLTQDSRLELLKETLGPKFAIRRCPKQIRAN